MSTQLDLIDPLGNPVDVLESIANRSGLQIDRTWFAKQRRYMNELVDVPRAATADPETSHIAAELIKASGVLNDQQRRVREMVERFPGDTSAELAAQWAKIKGGTWKEHRAMFGRRLPELAGFHVERGDARKCRVTGSKSITWWPA